jgi:hypothetical protein
MANNVAPDSAPTDKSARDGIAKHLLRVAGWGIVVVSIAVLGGAAYGGSDEFAEASKLVFNALLPLFGTWVGTVAAYYFSRENFETANKSVQNLVQLTVDQRLEKLKVDDSMIREASIIAVRIPANKDDAAVALSEILGKLSRTATRIPILTDEGALKYILHQSVIYKVVAERGVALAQQGQTIDVSKLTLADVIAHDDVKAYATAIGCVPSGATVAAAKTEMERVQRAQDVIVTQSGKLDEPLLGWLTNVDIGRLSKAQ